MAPQKAVPVIVGVGDIKNPSKAPEDAKEPLDLMLSAINSAASDTSMPHTNASEFLASVDDISVVQTWTWPYSDLPGLLASKMGAKPRHKYYSTVGGDKPVRLLDESVRRIAMGKTKTAIVTGGEALASLASYMAAKKTPPPHWTRPDEGATARSLDNATLPPGISADHNLGWPIQIYPLYENALRYHRSQSLRDNHTESAKLYAHFASVANKLPSAWFHGKSPASEADIGTAGPKNRMIDFPYPLLMNAFNTVNMAAACIVTSTDHARNLGIPEERWIYLLGAAGTSESAEPWLRPNYHKSASVSRSIDGAMQTSRLTAHDLDLIDIYSCFPIVPKLAARHLNLPVVGGPKPLTVLGGLTSFGGAGNNYSLHALVEMTRLLRRPDASTGLILANGGVLTYHHAMCLSSRAPEAGHKYPERNPLPDIVTDVPVPALEEKPQGKAKIETYTVDSNRRGEPALGHVIGRLEANGKRFVANHGNQQTLKELASWTREPIGRLGTVRQEGGRNVFVLDGEAGARL